jgi:hypothetical protein
MIWVKIHIIQLAVPCGRNTILREMSETRPFPLVRPNELSGKQKIRDNLEFQDFQHFDPCGPASFPFGVPSAPSGHAVKVAIQADIW